LIARAQVQEWSGKVRVSPYTPRQYRRTSHYTHHYTRHYQYASASTYHSSHRMVANPIGNWLLRMIR
jgi:hypothetical protein